VLDRESSEALDREFWLVEAKFELVAGPSNDEADPSRELATGVFCWVSEVDGPLDSLNGGIVVEEKVDVVVEVTRRFEVGKGPDEVIKEEAAGLKGLTVLEKVLDCALEVTGRAEESTVPKLAREHDFSDTGGSVTLRRCNPG
jgi:hypothetical protein